MSQSLRIPFGTPPGIADGSVPQPPSSPKDLPRRSWSAIAHRAARRATADRTSIVAGSLAFHSFLAIVPALVALIAATSLLGVSQSAVTTLVHGVGRALPAGASGVLS